MAKKKNVHAQKLGALGGAARAKNLSAERLQQIASAGGKARRERLSGAKRKAIAVLAVKARERKKKLKVEQRKGDKR